VTAGIDGRDVPIDGAAFAHRYAQQRARVIRGGSEVGNYYDVVDNTNGTLTLEQEAEGNITAGDKIAITSYTQPPYNGTSGGVQKHFGELESSDLPFPSWELFEPRYHGHANMPQRSEGIPMVKTYESSGITHTLKNCEFMALAFGNVSETSSDLNGTVSTTLVSDMYPGDDKVEVNATAGFSVGDIIYIENGLNGMDECAVVDSIETDDLALESPLKNYHQSNATVHIVRSTAGVPNSPIQHRLKVADEVPCFTWEQAYLRDRIANNVGDHIVHQFMGLIVSSMELSSTAGESTPLQASYDISGLQYRDRISADPVGTTTGTYISQPSTVTKEGYDRGVYKYPFSKVTVNGVEYGEASEFTASLSRSIETVYGHFNRDRCWHEDGDPLRHICGAVESENTVSVPMKNRNFLTLLKEGS
jgi:hypothetical protein